MPIFIFGRQVLSPIGARVVHQKRRGYGAAYLAGFSAAKGEYIIMGDADDTCDFPDLERFIAPLHEGIRSEAMPWANRYIGNPILSGLLQLLFCTDIVDCHCGMRSFTKKAYTRMALQTTGMKFASEMVVRAVKKP